MKRLLASVLLSASLGGPLVATQASASQNVAHNVTTSSKGWAVTLAVSKTTVRTGTKFSATITIVNRTGHSVTVQGCQPNFDFSVELANAKVPYQGLSGAVACSTQLRVGSTVIHAPITAVYSACGGQGQPSCSNPDLPVGTYHTVVNWPTGNPHIPEPGRLYINVIR
jgi:hypothetical protein